MNTFAALCALLNLVCCALCMLLVHAFFYSVGYEIKSKKVPLAIFCVILAAISFAPALAPEYFDLSNAIDSASTLCYIIYPYLMFGSCKKTAFFWIGIAMAASVDYLGFILNYAIKPGIIGQLITNIVLYIIIFSIIVLITRKSGRADLTESFDRFPPVASLMIFVAFLAAYYSDTASFDAEYTKETANLLTMFSSMLIVGCIADLVIKYLVVSQKKRATEKQLELELRHYSDMAQKNRNMRVFRHDFKNNLISVRALIDGGQYGEAEKYIDELYGRLDATKSVVSTGNHLADAILAEKYAAARERGVKIDFEGIIPNGRIENIDLCTILANALDNAIEGIRHVKNAAIGIRAIDDGAVFTLIISNPTDKPVEIKNNRVKTTKGDDVNHGLGIGSIRNAAGKYNGEVNLRYKNGYFTIEVMMITRKGAGNDEQ